MNPRVMKALQLINPALADAIESFGARGPKHARAVAGSNALEVLANAQKLGIRPASPVAPKPVAPRATVARPAPPPPKRAIVGFEAVAGGRMRAIEEDDEPEDPEDDDDDEDLDPVDDDETEQDEDDDEDDDEKETIMPKKNAEETKLEVAKAKLADTKAMALAGHARPAKKTLAEVQAERDAAKAIARGDR